MPSSELDAIDCNILQTLQTNARISNVELSEQVNLSPSPCSVSYTHLTLPTSDLV